MKGRCGKRAIKVTLSDCHKSTSVGKVRRNLAEYAIFPRERERERESAYVYMCGIRCTRDAVSHMRTIITIKSRKRMEAVVQYNLTQVIWHSKRIKYTRGCELIRTHWAL